MFPLLLGSSLRARTSPGLIGHPPLRGEGLNDQRAEWPPMDSPLLGGEGLGVRFARANASLAIY